LERNDAPEPTYERRLGYEPGFLGIDVPVPTLAQALTDNVAIPTGEGADGVDPVLRYHHFSVVQNGVRRMPFFTAVNIDGARSRDIDRDTGEVGEIEAAETWYEDPRVAGAQLTQAFFRENPGLFDRGHLVRRLDPAWGSKPVAKRAADDTFHFTNCCPQVGIGFNRSGKAWLGIETYVLDAARTADVRISVFSGPVFAAGDPPVGGINVPQAFWKIVARIDPTGTLRATGFIASQAHLVDKALGGPEAVRSWEDLGPIKVHQRRIDAIEAASELSFGDLRNHDTAPTVESVAQLTDVADAVW
jgi:endonuclease G